MLQVKMLLPRKRLKPRTFRAAIGQTIFVGGVLRVDVLESPGETVYATVWASEELVCHLGKTEGADERCAANYLSCQHNHCHKWSCPRDGAYNTIHMTCEPPGS